MTKSKIIHPSDVQMETIKKNGLFKSRQNSFQLFKEIYFNPNPNEYSSQVKRFQDLFKGKLYTFEYKNPLNKDVLEYYDSRPIILVINSELYEPTGHHLITGLNFNFIPYEMKRYIIEQIWNTFEKLIEMDINRSNGNPVLINSKQIFNPNYDFYKILKYILTSLFKSGFEFGLRKYIFQRCDNIKCIQYDHWGLIPFIDSKDIVGASVSDIFKHYWKFKNKR